MAQRSGPRDRLENRALLLRFPPARDLDFLRSPQSEHGAPRISGFWRLELFGFPWILSSEMSLFNGLHATPGPFLIHAALSPEAGDEDPAVIRLEGRPR